jgi:hypothetical protein
MLANSWKLNKAKSKKSDSLFQKKHTKTNRKIFAAKPAKLSRGASWIQTQDFLMTVIVLFSEL